MAEDNRGAGSRDQETDTPPAETDSDRTVRIGGELLDDSSESDQDEAERPAPESDAERTQAISIVSPDSKCSEDPVAEDSGTEEPAGDVEHDAERTQAISAVTAVNPDDQATERWPTSDWSGTENTWNAETERAAAPQTPEAPTERTEVAPDPAPTAWQPQPEQDTERTQTIAPVPPGPAERTQLGDPVDDRPAAVGSATLGAIKDTLRNRRGVVRAGIVAAAVVGVLTLLYVVDLAASSGKVPRGTVVAGVSIGGMSQERAEDTLREELGPGLHEPIKVQAEDSTASIDPDQAGLRMDWAATVQHAGSQPVNPFTRLTSLFSTRDVLPVTHGDRERLADALREVKPKLDKPSTEGAIRFEGTTPVPVEPVTGRDVNVGGATDAVLAEWAARRPIAVPFSERPVSTTEEGVQKALKEVAEPAVSAPVTVRGEGTNATLSPEAIAKVLRFKPDGHGDLKADIDIQAAAKTVEPQLASSITPGRDAKIVLRGSTPVVEPSVDGHGINWEKSFEPLVDVLKKSEDRDVEAVYEQQPAKFTTDQANKLGIREVVSEFTTEGFETASGVNIKRVAEEVDGAIVKPGETFSLNGYTGPRTTAQGYVESGIIEDGRPARAVGGGISQFATTLFNASYFAAMQDVEHKEHSYYISRYPEGREATVFQNPDGSSVIDVKFKNTTDHGIMISTEWTPSSITVRFWGTKQYEVTSETSDRSNPTNPPEKVIPPGEPCEESSGIPGFTVYNTRTIKNLDTGEVTTEDAERTVYDPEPVVRCAPPPPH